MELRQEERLPESTVSATAAPASVGVDAPPVADIVKRLSSRNEAVRAKAEKQLAALGPESTDELLAALEVEGKKYQCHKRRSRWTLYIGGGVIGLYLSVGLIWGLSSGHWDLLSNLGSFGGVFGGVGAAAAISPKHKSILKAIADLDDVRSTGWLVDALNTKDRVLRVTVEDTLSRILPTLEVDEAAYLDDDRRRLLDRKLIKTTNRAFAIAILRTYECLGDSHSLPSLERVEADGAALKGPDVVQAARSAAAAIRARSALEHEAQTLLRPSSTPQGQTDMLLRPAAGSQHEPESVLLRPARQDSPRQTAL